MKKSKKEKRPDTATYKLYVDDMDSILSIYNRDMKRWEKKKEGAKPWIADAFRKFMKEKGV